MFNVTFKHAALVLALAAVTGAAQAASVAIATQSGTIAAATTLPGYAISLPSTSSASFTASITGSAATGIGDVLSFGLYDSGNHMVTTASTPVDTFLPGLYRESYTLYFNNLTAGAYTLKLTSGLVGGTYKISGSYNGPTAPVPEPVSLALSLAGVAVVLAVRRRV